MSESQPGSTPPCPILTPRERRVAGVLVEKSRTTPEYYPMTVSAVMTACNQKTNRDPIVNYDLDDAEEILHGLRKRGGLVMVDAGGRVPRWKHEFYEWLKVSRPELAVLAELWLRGPQTEGDLRARAARMEKTLDLPGLQAILQALSGRGLVHYLSPPGQKRGVVVAHGFYPPDELAKIRQSAAARFAAEDSLTNEHDARSRSTVDHSAELEALRGELNTLRSELDDLKAAFDATRTELLALKSALGA